jgi:alpha-D-xyloside xylohydrolase
MILRSCLFLFFLPIYTFSQDYKGYILEKNRVEKLNIIPLADEIIRVQWIKENIQEEQELILIHQPAVPKFKFTESIQLLVIKTAGVSVEFNKQTGAITYKDNKGEVFLKETAGSRVLEPQEAVGEKFFIAGQSFESPSNERLFGLGQFQDGHYNLRNISRKLLQVNTQIAIPFLYSSKGYGILWHQYGLSYFNPVDQVVDLTKSVFSQGVKGVVEVTTTSGTQKISQDQSLYTGKFAVTKDGEYSFMLDLGNMESRHLLMIDGIPCIDQSNLWLPPAASKIINLKAGEHTVEVICKSSNTPSLTWNIINNKTTFKSPNAKNFDYVVFKGDNADEVIRNYRQLSGTVPMLPIWAYGFWQCRERYTSGDHLVETVKEFRRRKLPMDVIVQDWQYWGKYGWGVPKFDEAHYPQPEKFIKQLHNLNARFSISVWENLDKKSEVAKEYIDKNLFIPSSQWIDIFNPKTQRTHWNVLNKNLFSLGVDSWWMDATEPENDALNGKQTYLGSGDFYRLTYPLFVSKAVYEGQRHSNPNKRVAILTRSAFAGQQRYGTISWSGDIGWNWDTFRRQIVAGLNFSLTGMPYWTTDIGGFFRPGAAQYQNSEYHDILTRWFQFGTFNPIFRIHGYQSETEPWKYGKVVEENMRTMLNLRYRLMPYIYSEGWKVSSKGSTLMRPMVMDFAEDTKAIDQPYQFMFGKSFLVAPVTQSNTTESEIYLPKAANWIDFWSNERYVGGTTFKVPAPQNRIPLFVREGSVIVSGKAMQYTQEKNNDTLDVRIFSGANGEFDLYEDEGDGYNYEKDKYSLIPFHWNNTQKTLTIQKQQGTFPGQLTQRVFNVELVNPRKENEQQSSTDFKTLRYSGRTIKLKFN